MKHFSGKDKKKISDLFPNGITVEKKDELIEHNDVLFKNKDHFLIQLQIDNSKTFEYIPHLKSKHLDLFKTITIDVGAVPFLLKGADMMRPGITQIDEGFNKDDLVIVIDEVKNLKIGVGRALFDSSEMNEMKTGKVIKTLHYFKDNYYGVNM